MNSQHRLHNAQPINLTVMAIALTLMALMLVAPVAYATSLDLKLPASIETLKPNRYARINEPAYQTLANAQTQVDKQQHDAALKTLEQLISSYAQNPYIVSLALRSAAWVMLDAEQTSDAIKLAEIVIRLNSLDEASIASLQHTLAQLYYHNEQYEEAAVTLSLWLTNKSNRLITAEDYYLLGLAHYELANWPQSISAAKQGLKLKPAAAEPFWQLILSCQLQQEDYPDATKSLAALLALQPNETTYWTQWVSVQLQLQNTKEALAALELMAIKGLLQTEPLALQYVHLLAQQGNPAKAAEQLTRLLKNNTITKDTKQELYLAQLWAQAGESARALSLFKHLKKTADLPEADQIMLDQWLAYLQSREP